MTEASLTSRPAEVGNTPELILEMSQICKAFPGVQALDKVDFRLKRGEVHALVGENGAGKSTLMKTLTGLYQPDSGEIFVKGQPVRHVNSAKSLESGISMIHQELNLVDEFTVAENIYLGREPLRRFFRVIDWRKAYTDTAELLHEYDTNLKPRDKVGSLNVSNMQIVEIVKAISYNSDILIMDEPTSAITEREVAKLFDIIRGLKQKGVSFIYISHILDEIFDIADHVTVLRDGRSAGSEPIGSLDRRSIISMMVGRELKDSFFKKSDISAGRPVLAVRNLTRDGVFRNVSFEVKQGEILGVAGLMGSGRTEIARAIFGLDTVTEGSVQVDSHELRLGSVNDAIAAGIAMVSEDRKRYGLVLTRSVKENVSLPVLRSLSRAMWIDVRKEKEKVADIARQLSVKTPRLETEVNSLSGGNQQKVVLAKWLLSAPKVLILDEPTRGIDVGAKAEIYSLMNDLAANGLAILMISSEMEEILHMSDRILVVHQGAVRGILNRDEATQEKILHMAIGPQGEIDET